MNNAYDNLDHSNVDMTNIVNRLDDLESKLTFQEATIEELNNVITKQSYDIERMKVAIRFLEGKLKECNVSNVALPSEETPPPHY